ncbi:hypothetical protein FRC08_006033 [Ceratobasidium sp. 394]|nr:hypothetical protein FRC08_006033 [Ceratobasidium sp. 394]
MASTPALAALAANPALAALADSLTDEHKVFWNDYIGEPFLNQIGPRGKKGESARKWTRKIFIDSFCDRFFPSLSPHSRSKVERLLGMKVYSYLTNHSSRGTHGVTVKPIVVKQRVYAYDVWKREEPEAFNQALRYYQADNPGVVLNASESPKTLKAVASLSGDERTKYIEQFTSQVNALLKKGELCAGIKMNIHIVFEDAAGSFNITTIVTDSMSKIEDSPELDQFIQRIKDYIKLHAGKPTNDNGESPQDRFPRLQERHVSPCPHRHRPQSYRGLEDFFQGGQGRFPWELVSADLDSWIPVHRRPPGATLTDPSTMRLSLCMTWMNWFHDEQKGVIPLDCRTQLSRVFAGLSPIDSSLSQESPRRLEFTHQNKETWILEFDETVTRCHAPGGMSYPPASVEYAKYIKRHPEALSASSAELAPSVTFSGLLSASSWSSPVSSSPPRSEHPDFLELPTGESHPSATIDGQEKALLLKWSEELPEIHRTPARLGTLSLA